MMDERLQDDFLQAAAELVLRQGELLPRVEAALGVDPYDYWIRCTKGPPQDSDPEHDDEWRWDFHGLEVDITHLRDGRFVRVDFGPRGRRDVFTDFGIGCFVCHTRAPWREFPRLRAALDEGRELPKFDVVNALGDALFEAGYFEQADARMAALVQTYTRRRPDGYDVVAVPEALRPESYEEELDLFLACRWTISARGRERLASLTNQR